MTEQNSEFETFMLLGSLNMASTRLWRLHARLLDFGRPEHLPEDRDSRNPVRWLAAETACRVQDFMLWRLRRSFRERGR